MFFEENYKKTENFFCSVFGENFSNNFSCVDYSFLSFFFGWGKLNKVIVCFMIAEIIIFVVGIIIKEMVKNEKKIYLRAYLK